MRTFYRAATGIANQIDRILGINITEKGGRIYRFALRILSPVRRILDPLFIQLSFKLGKPIPEDLKLYLGCGWRRFEGYVNVDIWITDATDVICDISDLPWPKNSVAVIEAYHVIEHISHTRVMDTLFEWYRVLRPGGKLILECPDFDLAVQEYLHGNHERLMTIFGRQRFYGDVHLYGYNPKRLMRLLDEVGFDEICEKEPQTPQSLEEPCMRIVCRKPI